MLSLQPTVRQRHEQLPHRSRAQGQAERPRRVPVLTPASPLRLRIEARDHGGRGQSAVRHRAAGQLAGIPATDSATGLRRLRNDSRSLIVDDRELRPTAPCSRSTRGTITSWVRCMVDLANMVIEAEADGTAARQYPIVTASYWGSPRGRRAAHAGPAAFFKLGHRPSRSPSVPSTSRGIVANLGGGWLATRFGIPYAGRGPGAADRRFVMLSARSRLTAAPRWRGLSPPGHPDLPGFHPAASVGESPRWRAGQLFKWVAYFTGSKNAKMRVISFFGGPLLDTIGFKPALWLMAAIIGVIFVAGLNCLPRQLARRYRQDGRRVLRRSRAASTCLRRAHLLFDASRGLVRRWAPGLPLAAGWRFVESALPRGLTTAAA